uniref:Protein RCC2 n=1 Tax=Globodera pallida TaxID=36090 RepID=A0A183CNS8_GLOPA
VYAGGCAMGAVTDDGHMFSWGANRHGMLALSHRNHQHFPYQKRLGTPPLARIIPRLGPGQKY